MTAAAVRARASIVEERPEPYATLTAFVTGRMKCHTATGTPYPHTYEKATDVAIFQRQLRWL